MLPVERALSASPAERVRFGVAFTVAILCKSNPGVQIKKLTQKTRYLSSTNEQRKSAIESTKSEKDGDAGDAGCAVEYFPC